MQKTIWGKFVIFGGEFRQTWHVIENGTNNSLIESSLINSSLWHIMIKIKLTENMIAITDPCFLEFLLRVGECR